MITGALRKRNLTLPRQVNHITVRSRKIRQPLTLAVVSDFHDGLWEDLLPHLQGSDAILLPGDLVDRHSGGYERGLRFLKEATRIAPVFYAIGNHEWKHPRHDEFWPQVQRTAATVLDDRYVEFGGILLGGLSSRKNAKEAAPFVADMAAEKDKFRLLMCHHPEYFARHVQHHDIDLTLAGHAHGGQVRLGRQGVYAPGQGLFPRLTSGFYHGGRLLVSRGATNATWAPRIGCGCEIIILHLEGDNGQGT
ncbi:MAG: metallophosphoesterase [Clostridia bacterium]|nr:metallophosphoesterase [Clostridia bacterium]